MCDPTYALQMRLTPFSSTFPKKSFPFSYGYLYDQGESRGGVELISQSVYYSGYDIRVCTVHQYRFKLGSAPRRSGALVLGNPINLRDKQNYRHSMLATSVQLVTYREFRESESLSPWGAVRESVP